MNDDATVISVTNQKGGVAKTTTAIHLASGLAALGKKTILIDIDSQKNATGILLKKTEFEPGQSVFHLFKGIKAGSANIFETDQQNLFVIPSSLQLVEVESMLSSSIDGFFRLSEGLHELKKEFSFMVFVVKLINSITLLQCSTWHAIHTNL